MGGRGTCACIHACACVRRPNQKTLDRGEAQNPAEALIPVLTRLKLCA